MKRAHDKAIERGLLDPDEPTEWAHYVHRVTADFTPEERAKIRQAIGLGRAYE